MEIERKKSSLLDKFQQDPLWLHINTLGLQEKVFDAEFVLEKIIFEVDYTTSQVTEMLGLKSNQQILNLLNRHDLKDYIRLMQTENGYYKFNHIGIFQLHMILFLREEGMQPLEIATLVGTVAQYSKGRVVKRGPFEEQSLSTHAILQNTLINKIDEVTKSFSRQLDNYKEEQNLELKKKDTLNQLALWEAEVRSVKSQIDRIAKNIDIVDKQPEVKVGIIARWLGIHKEESVSTLATMRTVLENDKKELELKECTLNKEIKKLLSINKEWIHSSETDRFSLKDSSGSVKEITSKKEAKPDEIYSIQKHDNK